jgi:hypothetical protein
MWEICKMVAFEQNEIIKKCSKLKYFQHFCNWQHSFSYVLPRPFYPRHFHPFILLCNPMIMAYTILCLSQCVLVVISYFFIKFYLLVLGPDLKTIAYSFENHKGFWTNSTSMSQSNSFVVFLWHEVNCYHYGGNDWS